MAAHFASSLLVPFTCVCVCVREEEVREITFLQVEAIPYTTL